jgi:hypothetical protein
MIYTSNEVEIYKIFKGTIKKNIIEILTVGGVVGDRYVTASHLLTLKINDIGVFFCENERSASLTANSVRPVFSVYSSAQGFIKYDALTQSDFTPFIKYDNVEKDLYKELTERTGRKMEIRNRSFNMEKIRPARSANGVISNQITLAPAITSFSPATVNAGAVSDPANNVLTITGTGFGPAAGDAAVYFRDANLNGPSDSVRYNDWHMISWSDTEIKVRVPAFAGTGVISVVDQNNVSATSATTLTVLYSISGANFGGSYGYKQFNLVNMNGTGGYTFKYSTSTANSGVNFNTSPAKPTFLRALATWKETVGTNFVEGPTTTLQVVDPNDGENVIMFDNAGKGVDYPDPLPNGVLAVCYAAGGLCGATTTDAFMTGFDIVFRNQGFSVGSVAFTYGPCSPYSAATDEVDLETVVLHELGHAHNLGHIIDPVEGPAGVNSNPAKVMHYAISYNRRRISLDYSAKQGALYEVNPHPSYVFGNCLPVPATPQMVPLATISESKDNCPGTFPVTTTPNFTTVPFDLTHATSNKYIDPGYNQFKLGGVGTSITNTAFYAFRTSGSGGDLSLEVINYSTTPAAVASCTPGYTGTPVTGVEIALYQVPACPTGGAYPAPVTYTSFAGSGIVPAISGLSGSTNYLMVFDGIQNTKAQFDLVFSGSALPLRVAEFSGRIANTANILNWKTDKPWEVEKLVLERSTDGQNFTALAEFFDSSSMAEAEYSDENPNPGANYYRLAIVNANGSTDYSTIVLLNRSEGFLIRVYPNPVGQFELLNIEIDNNASGKFDVSIHNSLGQLVLQKEVTVNSGNQKVQLDISKLAGGVYQVSVFGPDLKRIKSQTIRVTN